MFWCSLASCSVVVINTHKTVSKQSLTSITNHSVSNRPQNSTYTIIDTVH
jgi:hypothetical protein